MFYPEKQCIFIINTPVLGVHSNLGTSDLNG